MSRRVFVVVLMLAAISSGVVYLATRTGARGLVLTGIVTTDEVIVSSQVPGRLGQLLVKEGDTVTRGQVLALIEPEELKADRAYYEHTEEGSAAQVEEAKAALRYQTLQARDQLR